MTRPRIFLSAVSQEWRSLRQRVARLLASQGYDCVSQDDFATGHGELRQWLREQIDGCEGLIQLVGEAYGAEPPEPDPTWGRVSYTQYEFLYARDRGRKTWVLYPGGTCVRDTAPEDLDRPDPAALWDPAEAAAWQGERRMLQRTYRARLVADNHLRHELQSDAEVENAILKLRDELAVLHQREEGRWRRLGWVAKAIALGLPFIGGGGWWAFHHLSAEVQQVAVVNAEKIRAHLLSTIEDTHRRELAEADAPTDWQERQRRREAAEAAHAARLRRVDEVAAAFVEIEGRGGATGLSQEMARILAEQGVDEAIAFAAAQRSALLNAARRRNDAARDRNRVELAPLLLKAVLDEARGRTSDARAVYQDVLAIEPDWPQALEGAFWFEIRTGDGLLIYQTLSDARAAYEAAKRFAERGGQSSKSPAWVRYVSISLERLGEVQTGFGDLNGAEAHHREALRLTQTLVDSDPLNRIWRLDLAVGHFHVADVLKEKGRGDVALDEYRKSLAIQETLVANQPDNLEVQRGSSVIRSRIGDLLLLRGNADQAETMYRRSLEIQKLLANSHANHSMGERDLAMSYLRLGDVLSDQGENLSALENYQTSHEMSEKLAAQFPSNRALQRELAVAHNRVGDALKSLKRDEEALSSYRRALGIIEALVEHDPGNSEWRRDLALGYAKVSESLNDQGKSDEALTLALKAREIASRLASRGPDNERWQRDLANTMDLVGDAQLSLGRRQESLSAYQEAKAIRERLVLAEPTNKCLQSAVAASLSKFGSHPIFSVTERRKYLLRGRETLVDLQNANYRCPGENHVPWFETALSKLR